MESRVSCLRVSTASLSSSRQRTCAHQRDQADAASVPGTAGIAEAVAVMRDAGVRRLLVTGHEGQLAGFVSADDLLEALAEQLGVLASAVRSGSRARVLIERRSRPRIHGPFSCLTARRACVSYGLRPKTARPVREAASWGLGAACWIRSFVAARRSATTDRTRVSSMQSCSRWPFARPRGRHGPLEPIRLGAAAAVCGISRRQALSKRCLATLLIPPGGVLNERS